MQSKRHKHQQEWPSRDAYLPCKQTPLVTATFHAVLAGSPSRWLTGMWMDIQPSVPPNNPGLSSGQHGRPTAGELSPPGGERCTSNFFPQKEPLGSLLVVALIIKMTMPMLIIRKHKIKTEARSTTVTASALCNGKLLTARYCLPSDSLVWVLCTNIYQVPWVPR